MLIRIANQTIIVIILIPTIEKVIGIPKNEESVANPILPTAHHNIPILS